MSGKQSKRQEKMVKYIGEEKKKQSKGKDKRTMQGKQSIF